MSFFSNKNIIVCKYLNITAKGSIQDVPKLAFQTSPVDSVTKNISKKFNELTLKTASQGS